MALTFYHSNGISAESSERETLCMLRTKLRLPFFLSRGQFTLSFSLHPYSLSSIKFITLYESSFFFSFASLSLSILLELLSSYYIARTCAHAFTEEEKKHLLLFSLASSQLSFCVTAFNFFSMIFCLSLYLALAHSPCYALASAAFQYKS